MGTNDSMEQLLAPGVIAVRGEQLARQLNVARAP
jgi:hypothetical protein